MMTNTIRLSDQQVADYHEDGYLIIRNVLSTDEIAEFRQYVQQQLETNTYPPSLKHSTPGKYTISGNQTNSASACNTLAMFYLERNSRLDEALALAKRAVKFKPISSYWDTLAYSLYKKQKYEEADKAIKRALELQPDYTEYLTRQQAIQKHLTE